MASGSDVSRDSLLFFKAYLCFVAVNCLIPVKSFFYMTVQQLAMKSM